jgi:serine/threonine protein kinase
VDGYLLDEQQAGESFFQPGLRRAAISGDATHQPLLEGPGTIIGNYKLVRLIGEGGFGSVFMAQQEEPVKRLVALKIIKLGMDTRQVVARFEAERQALALMDHSNIARVFDGGSTESGRPYFVMELVKGVAITEYCDREKLKTRQRLELFLQVCQATQHAHQKGIIHRDIKPSNVLVTVLDDKPVPKVIDFGIAKAIDQQLTERTLFTEFRQMVGTPQYMSPEQAQMGRSDIDTRSDIYSLGVLLYELLTGSTPFDAKSLREAAFDEIRRIIREVEPPKPSTRLSSMGDELRSVGEHRQVDGWKLAKSIRGDLDWLVMKCLEKDRARRYDTASSLLLDVQRYLENEPITARPPSSTYRFGKLVRRNKLAFGAATAVILAIVIGMGLAAAGLFRANREGRRAEAALALADDNFREARAAVDDLLRISDERLKDQPGVEGLRTELMKAAIDRYEPFLARPIADPAPREELARLYARYGQAILQRSEIQDQSVMAELEKARMLQEQLLQEYPRDRSLRMDLGWTLILEEWRPHTAPPLPDQAGRHAIEVFSSLAADDPKDPFARDDLIWALWRLVEIVKSPEAAQLANQAAAIGEKLVEEYPASAEFRRDLANALTESSAIWDANPTPQALADALRCRQRSLELVEAVSADLKSNRPEAFLPERPKDDQARMAGVSPLWAEYDVADKTMGVGWDYILQKDWPDAAVTYDQAVSSLKDLVEVNPSVATFADDLRLAFTYRVACASHAHDLKKAAAWAKDAMAFWNHLMELHPEIPKLRTWAGYGIELDLEVGRLLSKGASTQPASSKP